MLAGQVHCVCVYVGGYSASHGTMGGLNVIASTWWPATKLVLIKLYCLSHSTVAQGLCCGEAGMFIVHVAQCRLYL